MNWNLDLSSTISEEDRERASAKIHKMSINSHLRILQFKWLMRMYVTPVHLNKYNNNIPDLCIKCNSKGTLIHCMWECRQINLFWKEVRDIIEKFLSMHISLDPKLFLLALHPEKHNFNKTECTFIDISLLSAKKMYCFGLEECQQTQRHSVVNFISISPKRG